MKKGVTVIIILALLLMPTIMAMDINVKTWPNHKVSIFLLGTSGVYSLLDSSHIQTTSDGMATMTYSGTQSKIQINVKITKDGEEKLFEKFGEFDVTEDAYLQAIPGDVKLDYREPIIEENITEVNETVVEEVVEETTEQQDAGLVVGFAIAENIWRDYSNVIYYVLAGIAAVGLVIFTMAQVKKHKSGPYLKYNVPEDKIRAEDDKKIEKAEEQIQHAQEMIEEVKHREAKQKQLEQAKKQYQEAKEKLKDLEK